MDDITEFGIVQFSCWNYRDVNLGKKVLEKLEFMGLFSNFTHG